MASRASMASYASYASYASPASSTSQASPTRKNQKKLCFFSFFLYLCRQTESPIKIMDDETKDVLESEQHTDYKPSNRFDAAAVHHLSGMYRNWFRD